MFLKRALLFLSVATCFGGCLSTEVSKSEVCGTEHIFVQDYGWKLFNCIPLFRPDITLKRVRTELEDEAKRRGKTAENLTWHNYDTIIFTLPILYVPIPIPYLICYQEVQLSGVLK